MKIIGIALCDHAYVDNKITLLGVVQNFKIGDFSKKSKLNCTLYVATRFDADEKDFSFEIYIENKADASEKIVLLSGDVDVKNETKNGGTGVNFIVDLMNVPSYELDPLKKYDIWFEKDGVKGGRTFLTDVAFISG